MRVLLSPFWPAQTFSCKLFKTLFPRCSSLKAMLMMLISEICENFRYVEKTSAECNEDSYLVILHLSRVELHCKLQEKLHRVTWPLLESIPPLTFLCSHRPASSLVASVWNRDQWKNNGSAVLNGNNATARTDEGLWKSPLIDHNSRFIPVDPTSTMNVKPC
jgi:hypothetical protein